MATFQSVAPELRAYFKKHSIPDIYEALLCGLLIMCPDDPLRFLEEKIKEIMEKGLYNILCAWIKYCDVRRIGKQILQRKLSFARHFHEFKLLKSVLAEWNAWVQLRKEEHEQAAKRIGKVFACSLQKIILKAWQKETSSRRKAKKYMEHIERDLEDVVFDEEPERRHVVERERRQFEKRSSSRYISDDHGPILHIRTGKDHLTKMPGRVLAQIFRHLTVIDLARCAQVNRTWKAMTQTGSVWSNINFSAVKDIVKDNIAGNILLRWSTNVVHLNLRGCSTLQWLTFKSIGRCTNLQELNVSECQGLNRFCFDVRRLDYIDFSFCHHLSNHSLKNLTLNCRKLTSLSMAGCCKITDVGIQFVAACCNFLHYLDISGCINITDKALKFLWKGCQQLRILKMLYCKSITRQAVLKYASKLQKYEYSDDEPPLWFSYDSNGDTATLKKPKKRRQSTASPRHSIVPSSEEQPLENAGSSKLESVGEKISETSEVSILEPPVEKSDEYVTPLTVETPEEN